MTTSGKQNRGLRIGTLMEKLSTRAGREAYLAATLPKLPDLLWPITESGELPDNEVTDKLHTFLVALEMKDAKSSILQKQCEVAQVFAFDSGDISMCSQPNLAQIEVDEYHADSIEDR